MRMVMSELPLGGCENSCYSGVQRKWLSELVSQQMAPQKTIQGLSHQFMAQKTVQELIPRREKQSTEKLSVYNRSI